MCSRALHVCVRRKKMITENLRPVIIETKNKQLSTWNEDGKKEPTQNMFNEFNRLIYKSNTNNGNHLNLSKIYHYFNRSHRY